MNAVFLPVFAQHLWAAVALAGLTAASIGGLEALTKRQRAVIRVKRRPAGRRRH